MGAGRRSSGDSLGGIAAGIDGARPLPRVRQDVRGVRWPGRNDKRHPSMLGVLPAQPGSSAVTPPVGCLKSLRRSLIHGLLRMKSGATYSPPPGLMS
jgi:hypothetical protein